MKNRSHTSANHKNPKKSSHSNHIKRTNHVPTKTIQQDQPPLKKQINSAHIHSQPSKLQMFYYQGTNKSAHVNFYQMKNNKQHFGSMHLHQEIPKKKSKTKQEKKKTNKKKVTKKKSQEQQPLDYVMFGQSFYCASTVTERHQYKEYLQNYKSNFLTNNVSQIKKRGINQGKEKRKGFISQFEQKSITKNLQNISRSLNYENSTKNQNCAQQQINIDQIVSELSHQQKQRLFYELQKQFGSTHPTNNQFYKKAAPKQKYNLTYLLQQFDKLKHQLQIKYNKEKNKIGDMLESANINKIEYEYNILMLEATNKQIMSSIKYTQFIFQTLISKEKDEDSFEIQKYFQSNSEGYQLLEAKTLKNKQAQKDSCLRVISRLSEDIANFQNIKFKKQNLKFKKQQQIYQKLKNSPVVSKTIKSGKIVIGKKPQIQITQQSSIKSQMSQQNRQNCLFAQKQFINMEPQFEILDSFSNNHQTNVNQQSQKEQVNKNTHSDTHKKSISDDLLITPSKTQNSALQQQRKQNLLPELHLPLVAKVDQNQLETVQNKFDQLNLANEEQQFIKKIKIPMLLTKEKVQQLQNQYENKVTHQIKNQLDRKIAFQMSELQYEDEPTDNHFTTLADINGFIVGLYEFIIRSDLDKVVDKLNLPYGKSVRDKLFILHNQGGPEQQLEYYTVLDEQHFNKFNEEIVSSGVKLRECQRIHNHAVFDAFNYHLNAYRPYFQLQGEVYPWQVSQKGITFYEISDENIQQVFQKTKVKILEYSAMLCGVQLRLQQQIIIKRQRPNNQSVNNVFISQIIEKKNEEQLIKEEKATMIEEFNRWQINYVDIQTKLRLDLSTEIYNLIMTEAAQQMNSAIKIQNSYKF